MHPKLAAARQLGALGLLRRFRWRVAMASRIIAFHLLRKRRAANFGRGAGPLPIGKRTFLPDFAVAAEKLRGSPGLEVECRRRVDRQCAELFRDTVTLRGTGTIELVFDHANWYGYEHGVAIMLNRHDFVIPLVQSAVLDNNQMASAKLNAFFGYWLENFRINVLIERDTPIDAAIRLINWMWAIDSGVLDVNESRRRKLCEVVYLQLEYIRAWQSAGGNHLVLEALAGYIVGCRFENAGPASSWKKWGRETLLAELERQTTADGVHSEQSMFYHHAVSSHYLKFFLTATSAGDELPAIAHRRFEKMLAYVHDTAKENGTHPVIGDGEELTSDDREHWESRALLGAYSRIFGESVYRGFSEHVGDAICWLLGCNESDLTYTDAQPGSAVLQNSGLAMLRHADQTVFFDAAPFSDAEFPHHGHADALSIDVSVGGVDLFVDPGGYGYYDDAYRRYFRSTAAHNTIEVDGENQSELFGVLGYGRLANSQLLASGLAEDVDFVRGTHDGYSPSRHVREVYLVKQPDNLLLVVDMIDGAEGHQGVLRYHMAAETVCTNEGQALKAQVGERTFHVAVATKGDCQTRLISGKAANSLMGWVSPETKRAVKSTTWEISSGLNGFTFFVTAVSLTPGKTVRVGKCGASSVEVEAPERSYRLDLSSQSRTSALI